MIVQRPEMRVGEKRKVEVEGKVILLIYLGGERYLAFDNACPHLGCDLSKYGVLIREELVCQCHFSHFSVRDGRPLKGASKRPIPVYSVKVEGDRLVLERVNLERGS
ncbi:3-phenylpropionate/cinnamic acid dioxygenase ferredoxin subunit [Metallosphaera sp. J1]|uniref:Rieske (2Fe-2S) protein n=1 Tax=Metallosphaera javensis (ex Hofmann et al. 2022) TaxID=99938 RepID=UPI001EDE556B|nr:Rieske (2Fe-2S) protein [Metallosphaera javensis (ex Hofmann et al. 2022)]MCG3109747.1 3-phenylpropionate/cinnamic acid dioxygenase ferredoxin subunit [Metallosphaera javensis (ex Hofmann et al. 2022)]